MKVPKAFKTPLDSNNNKSYDKNTNCSFWISESILNRFNSKIGYTSRSKVITQLILEYVNKKDLEKK